jgi:5-methylcytosine-specific restriction endonuclease McrA
MASGWGAGSTRQWRKVRLAVLQRDRYVCQLAIPGVCQGAADSVHHMFGRLVTGDDPRWLQAACMPCNLAVGQPGRRRGTRKVAGRMPLGRPLQYGTSRRDAYNRW